jgi:hypothetical protein
LEPLNFLRLCQLSYQGLWWNPGLNLIDHFHFLQKFSWHACFFMQIMCIPTSHVTSSYAIYCLQIASETHPPGGTTWSESYLCCKRNCIFLYFPQAGNVQPHVIVDACAVADCGSNLDCNWRW